MPYVTSIEQIAEQRGIILGLLEGIKMDLELKFGNEGLQLLPEISRIQDLELLRAVYATLKQANTLSELRLVYYSLPAIRFGK